jgi:hypothetical protein
LYVRCFVQCKSHMPLLPLLLAICSSRPTMREPNIFAFRTNNFQLRAVTVTQKIFAANEASPYHFLSFIHSVFILTACRQPIPKPVLHIVRLRVSSLNFQFPLASLRSSTSCLSLLHCLPVTAIFPCIFPSMWFRRQFLLKMWAIQLVFPPCITCRISLSSLTVLHHFLSNNFKFYTCKMQVQSVISYELQDNLSIPSKERNFALRQHFETGSGPLTF